RLGDVQEVMGYAVPLLRGRLGRPHFHPPVDEHRVDAHDLRAEGLGHRQRRLGLPRSGGAHQGQEGPQRHGEAAFAPTGARGRSRGRSSPSRKWGCAPVMRACPNVPPSNSPSTWTNLFVLVRAASRRFLPSPSTSTSTCCPISSRFFSS